MRLKKHQENLDAGDQSPLYSMKRALASDEKHENTLLNLPSPNNPKKLLRIVVDGKCFKKIDSYPAWAITNTFNSLLEGAFIAHFAAFHSRQAWYDSQWDTTFGTDARKDLAGCNRTPGTESDFALKRWRYEPKEANGSKGVRTLEELLPVPPAASKDEEDPDLFGEERLQFILIRHRYQDGVTRLGKR